MVTALDFNDDPELAAVIANCAANPGPLAAAILEMCQRPDDRAVKEAVRAIVTTASISTIAAALDISAEQAARVKSAAAGRTRGRPLPAIRPDGYAIASALAAVREREEAARPKSILVWPANLLPGEAPDVAARLEAAGFTVTGPPVVSFDETHGDWAKDWNGVAGLSTVLDSDASSQAFDELRRLVYSKSDAIVVCEPVDTGGYIAIGAAVAARRPLFRLRCKPPVAVADLSDLWARERTFSSVDDLVVALRRHFNIGETP